MRGELRTSTRHFRVIFTAVVTLGAMVLPMTTQAMDWYGGLSYGQARHEATGGDLVGPGFFSGSVDGNDSGWKVLAGMELWDKYVAAEFGYVNFGKASATGTISGSTASGTSDAKAYTAAIAGFIPIGSQFGALIRLGIAGSQVTATSTASTSTHNNDMKIFGGFGFQYNFSKSMAARLEVERFNMGSVGSPYINLISAGLVYRFGR
jgi:hypothetical protein